MTKAAERPDGTTPPDTDAPDTVSQRIPSKEGEPYSERITLPSESRGDIDQLAILEQVDAEEPEARAPADLPSFCTARLVRLDGSRAVVRTRKQRPFWIDIDEEVDLEVLELAMINPDLSIIETVDAKPLLVGIVQRNMPRKTVIRGDEIKIEAKRELLLKSGTAAVRLREDGEVEVGGSRIVAMSKGLFKIVGRMLRLN